MGARSAWQIIDIEEIESEVVEKCLRIQAIVNEVRAKIKFHLCDTFNLHGCLRGSVDDYMKQFDPRVAKLKAKFEADRQSWQREMKVTQELQERLVKQT